MSEIENIQKRILGILQKHEVKRAAVFGSVATGTATKKSDLDLLVEFRGKKSLFDLAGLKIELENTLKRKVDVITYGSLHPLLRDRILKEQRLIL
ncbi:MAG: nucleotidyltransferase family protein [Candidatus Micrarchaeota archaeon]